MALGSPDRALSIGFNSRPLFPMALERGVRASEPFIVLSGGYTMTSNGTGLLSWPELTLGHLEGPCSFTGCLYHAPGGRRRHGP